MPDSFTLQLSSVTSLISYPEEPLFRIGEITGEGSTLFLFDENTRRLLDTEDADSFVIPPGEGHKRLSTVTNFTSFLLDRGAARDSFLVAVGGGVICDLASFTASIYMRGMKLLLLPTTLLAMVDAALGGKTGVDFQGYKNILGTFYPAQEVIVVPSLLKSLPEREYMNGLAEVIKHALLADERLFSLLRDRREDVLRRDTGLIQELIFRSQKVKALYVEQDPKEEGLRGFLNLGHTFAHALEAEGDCANISHGEAVAWGMVKALDTGREMGLTDPSYAREIRELISSYGYAVEGVTENPSAIAAATLRDKKKRGGQVRFVLQRRRGETFFSTVPEEVLMRVLEEG